MKKLLSVLAVAGLFCGCVEEKDDLPSSLVTITKDGDILAANGKHTAWIGSECAGDAVCQPESGGKAFRGYYDDKYRWIYETNATATQLHRIGWNILSTRTFDTCLRALSPDYKGFMAREPLEEYDAFLKKYGLEEIRPWSLKTNKIAVVYKRQIEFWESMKGQMPLFLQMQDGITDVSKERKKFAEIGIPETMFYGSTSHSGGAIPIQIGLEEGKEIYRKLYRHRQEDALRFGVRPLAYKLANEGIYWNYSDLNKQLFGEAMKKRYQSIEALNKDWCCKFKSFDEVGSFKGEGNGCKALEVEYHKFLQNQLTELCAYLKKDLRVLDKDANIMIQMHGVDTHLKNFPHYDFYGLGKILDVISTGTGNNGLTSFMNFDESVPFKDLDNVPATIRNYASKDSFYTALADGKPLMNTEAYSENSYDGFHRVLWREFALGRECVIQWAWFGLNWGPDVKKPFKFALMHPFACPAEAFAAIHDVRKEVESVGDIFLPRKNMQKAEVAALFSYPTLRYHQELQYPEAIASSAPWQIQVPVDTVLEEQLGEGRQSRYKVLLASGIHCVYDETNERLRKWVEDGGVLIVNQGLLNKSEYGLEVKNPLIEFSAKRGDGKVGRIEPDGIRALATEELSSELDSSWNVLGKLNGKVAHVCKKIGNGKIHVILGTLTDFGYASIIRPILENAGVKAVAEIRNPKNGDFVPGIDVHRFNAGKFTGWYFCNMNEMPKLVLFDDAALADAEIVNPFDGESYKKENGKVLLTLPAKGKRFVLVSGKKSDIENRFGCLPSKTYAQRIEAFNKEMKKMKGANVNIRKSVHVDISKVANGGFYNYQNYPIDSVWREDGIKELKAFPYHENVFGDLKFDVIRFDYNENRTCIELKSKVNPKAPAKVENIPLNGKYRGVAFLMAVTHGRNGEKVMDIKFNYDDGTSENVPVRVGQEIGDWMISKNSEDMMKKCVWKTADGKQGVFIFEWENPSTYKPLASISFISADPSSQPLIAAITALPTTFVKEFKNSCWVGKDQVKTALRGYFDDQSSSFKFAHNLRLILKDPIVIPQDKINDAVIRYEVRNNPDEWGIVRAWSYLPIGFIGMLKGEKAETDQGVADRAVSLTWEVFRAYPRAEFFTEIELPLKEVLRAKSNNYSGNLETITQMSFGPWGQQPFSRSIRNIRIEY